MYAKRLATLVCSLVAVVMILLYFVKIPPIDGLDKVLNSWGVTVSGFALGIGAINLARLHSTKLVRKDSEWFYSLVCLGVFSVMAVVGLTKGTGYPFYMFMFSSIIESSQASVASLTIFYLATSAFRAFRIRNLDATLMLGAGVIAIIGGAPMGSVIWRGFLRHRAG